MNHDDTVFSLWQGFVDGMFPRHEVDLPPAFLSVDQCLDTRLVEPQQGFLELSEVEDSRVRKYPALLFPSTIGVGVVLLAVLCHAGRIILDLEPGEVEMTKPGLGDNSLGGIEPAGEFVECL